MGEEPFIRSQLSGARLRLCASVVFMMEHWPFVTAGAREVLEGVDRSVFTALDGILDAAWRRAVGGEQDFAALVEAVRAAEYSVELPPEAMTCLVFSLRVCAIEFGRQGGWDDFSVASPGAVAEYGLTLGDFEVLADELSLIC